MTFQFESQFNQLNDGLKEVSTRIQLQYNEMRTHLFSYFLFLNLDPLSFIYASLFLMLQNEETSLYSHIQAWLLHILGMGMFTASFQTCCLLYFCSYMALILFLDVTLMDIFFILIYIFLSSIYLSIIHLFLSFQLIWKMFMHRVR